MIQMIAKNKACDGSFLRTIVKPNGSTKHHFQFSADTVCKLQQYHRAKHVKACTLRLFKSGQGPLISCYHANKKFDNNNNNLDALI